MLLDEVRFFLFDKNFINRNIYNNFILINLLLYCYYNMRLSFQSNEFQIKGSRPQTSNNLKQ